MTEMTREVEAAWNAEIEKRIAELDSGKSKTVSWQEVRRRNLAKILRDQPIES